MRGPSRSSASRRSRCWPALCRRARARSRSTPTRASTTTASARSSGTLAFGSDVAVNQTTDNAYVTDPAGATDPSPSSTPTANRLAFSALEGETVVSTTSEPKASRQRHGRQLPDRLAGKHLRPRRPERDPGLSPRRHCRSASRSRSAASDAACSIAVDMEGDIWGVELLPQQDRRVRLLRRAHGQGDLLPAGRHRPPERRAATSRSTPTTTSTSSIYGYANPEAEAGYAKKYDSEGNYLEDFAGGYIRAVSVDLSNNHVFTLEPSPFANGEYDSEVVEYDENGEAITSFGAPDPAHSFLGLTSPQGVDVDQTTHRDLRQQPARLRSGASTSKSSPRSGQALVPTVKTELPQLEPTEATLKGSIDLDGGGDATSCYFEWGTNLLYGQTAPCDPAAPISGPGVTPGDRSADRPDPGDAIPLPGRRQKRERHPGHRPRPGLQAAGAGERRGHQGQRGQHRRRADHGRRRSQRRRHHLLGRIRHRGLRPERLRQSTAAGARPSRTRSACSRSRSCSAAWSRTPPTTTGSSRSNEFGEAVGDEGILRTYAVDSTVDTCPNALIRKETGDGAAARLPRLRARLRRQRRRL